MNFILLIKKEELEAEDDTIMQDIFFSILNRVIVLLKTEGLYTSINIEILFVLTIFNSLIFA